MRRILIVASVLLVSACASAPLEPERLPPTRAPVSSAPIRGEPRALVGLTAPELVSRLGNPALQVREGTSLKLQFRSSRCVLDAYFYAQAASALRVVHVDTRALSGIDTNQAVCIASFEMPS
jgi:hypothetical protein